MGFCSGWNRYFRIGWCLFLASALSNPFSSINGFDKQNEIWDQFFASGGELRFQVKKSIEAFQSGNLFGRGPGEGIVRSHIPDAHTDFIYAVAAEEYGVFLCLIIVALYATIVIRSLLISCKENNMFIILSAAGLSASFGLQSIINMSSTLHLIPTKGMTLPFISYGGSSIIATAIGMGMLLAITRKNVHAEDKDDN